jgi:hypothetical protein
VIVAELEVAQTGGELGEVRSACEVVFWVRVRVWERYLTL